MDSDPIRFRCGPRGLAVLGILGGMFAIVAPASADLSLAGRWQVVRQTAFGAFTEPMVFGQVGTTVTSAIFGGTIDPSTGVFHLDGVRTCTDPVTAVSVQVPASMDGTIDASGLSFTGTFADHVQAGRSCLPIDGTMGGTFDGPQTCGNYLVDPGEECDGTACCVGCHFVAPGTSCAGPIPFCIDYVCTASHECVADPAQPDRDHDGLPDECDFCTTGDQCIGSSICYLYRCVAGSLQCQPDIAASDQDMDGIGDGCDACTAAQAIDRSRLDLMDLEGPATPRLRARGEIPLAPAVLAAVDPVDHGFRLQVRDAGGAMLVDFRAPTITGWTARASGGSWTYRNSGPAPVVEQIKLMVSPRAGTLRYRLRGSPALMSPGTLALPLTLTVVATQPTICGEHLFDAGTACSLRAGGRRVSCRTP